MTATASASAVYSPSTGGTAPLFGALMMLAAAGLVTLPFVTFVLCSFALINLPAGMPRYARLGFAVMGAVAFAMMTGARPLDPSASNDIDVYYDLYLDLGEGHLEALFTFGGGIEVALLLLNLACSALLPKLSPNGLMFVYSLTAALLMVGWAESAFYGRAGRRGGAVLGMCLLMLNLYFATQLSRQFIALIVMLYAITASTKPRQAVWLALAVSFHVTALPFFGLYLLARRGWRGWLLIIAAAFVLRVVFWDLVAAFDIVPEAVAGKLAYYLDNSQEFTESDLGSLRIIALLAAISLASFAAQDFRPSPASRPWLAAPWIAAAVHLLLLPIPLASLRTTLIVHSVVPGLIAWQMLPRGRSLLVPTVLNVLLAYKAISFALTLDSGNLLPTMTMLDLFLAP